MNAISLHALLPGHRISRRVGGWSAGLLLAGALVASAQSTLPPPDPTRWQCGTLDLRDTDRSWFEFLTFHELVRSRSMRGSFFSAEFRGSIPIAFHVLHHGSEGIPSMAAIEEQVAILNQAFHPLRFRLASIDLTDHPRYFRLFPFLFREWEAKTLLGADPATHLNIYTCKPLPVGDAQLLGWAYFSFMYPLIPQLDGVVIDVDTLPGGSIPDYSEGDTLVHEVGHWMGLFHTFQGRCRFLGDLIADTPRQETASRGCEIGRDTCPDDPGPDPIHNYMDYSSNACADHFTPQQFERMMIQLFVYRPLIWAQLVFGPG